MDTPEGSSGLRGCGDLEDLLMWLGDASVTKLLGDALDALAVVVLVVLVGDC